MTAQQSLEALNDQFAIEGKLSFIQCDELIIMVYQGVHCEAEIVLQGAHLIKWVPADQKPVIWLSDDAVFKTGKSIRGGIPVCWPWFGAHTSRADLPAHGFARAQNWEIAELEITPDDELDITFQFVGSVPFWPYDTPLHYRLLIGDSLSCDLTTQNNSDQAVTIGGALHTYFSISSIDQISIHGLETRPFIDTLDQNQIKTEEEPIKINAEIDRIYQDEGDTCVIHDPKWKRNILIEKSGSHSTVVWNPWIAKSERMGDMGSEGYKTMVCVETTNAAEDVINLQPGESHTLSVTYSID